MGKRERTRQHIIEQSAAVFNTKGYAGTSMQDIMDATGLKKGGIYGNFDNKMDIAEAAFEYAVKHVTNTIRLRTQTKSISYDKLLTAVDFYREYLIKPPVEGGCPILNLAPEVDDTNPALRSKAQKALDNWRHSIQRAIEKGIEKEEIKPNVNAEEFAIVFIAMLEGGIMMGRTLNNPKYLHTVLNRLENMIHNELVA